MNRKRVLTYEMITEFVCRDDTDFFSCKTITMHIGNLRKKLKVAEDIPDYIKSVHGVWYPFTYEAKDGTLSIGFECELARDTVYQYAIEGKTLTPTREDGTYTLIKDR